MLEQLELKLNVRQRLESCTLAEKQQVLLARALSHQCRFHTDEPTAPLDQEESARLFRVVRRLQSEGIGIVFISHRIHELREVCDQLTVLRDGRRVSHDTMEGMSGEQIVEKCSAIHWRIFPLGERQSAAKHGCRKHYCRKHCYRSAAYMISISCAISPSHYIRAKF